MTTSTRSGELRTSPTVGALATALAKAQAEMTPAPKDGANPMFRSRYATLPAVIEASKALAAHGIAVVQFPVTGGSVDVQVPATAKVAAHTATVVEVGLTTRLLHESGEWLEQTLWALPAASGPQAHGSLLTYLRRYALSAVACIASEEDDDANAAQGAPPPAPPVKAEPKAKAEPKPEPKTPAPAPAPGAASADELKAFAAWLNETFSPLSDNKVHVEAAKVRRRQIVFQGLGGRNVMFGDLTPADIAAVKAYWEKQVDENRMPDWSGPA